MEFNGVKVALLHNGRLLMHLRDNTPGLFNANMWDFPGGGREGGESPEECAIREVEEEFGITLTPDSFIWKKEYPAQKNPDERAFFFVGSITQSDIDSINLTEGQKWELVEPEFFFESSDVVEALKGRFKNYQDSLN